MNEVKEIIKQPQSAGILATIFASPLLLPAAVGVVAVGGIAYLIGKNRSSEEKSNCSEPLTNGTPTVEPTVTLAVNEPSNVTVDEPLTSDNELLEQPLSQEEYEKEMLRQTMSMLGKRSAAKRRAS